MWKTSLPCLKKTFKIFVLFSLIYRSSSYIPVISVYVGYRKWKYILPIHSLQFLFLNGVFWCVGGFNFDEVQFNTFSLLWLVPLGSSLRNPCLPPRSWRYSPTFSSRCFIILTFTFASWIDFCVVWCRSQGLLTLFSWLWVTFSYLFACPVIFL